MMADEAAIEETVNDAATGGLLDDAKIETAATAELSDEPDHVDRQADGKKPDFVADRFYDEETGKTDWEGIAKSQSELYSKLRANKHSIPDDGKYDTKFLDGKVPEDDEILQKFKTVASDRGLTQDDFEEIASQVIELAVSSAPPGPDPEQEKLNKADELSKLGPNGEDILNGHVQWAQSLVQKEVWTGEDFDEFKIWGGSANGIKALTRLRQYYGEKPIPVHTHTDGDGQDTEDELQALVGDPKMQTDPAYRKKVYDRFDRKYGVDGLNPDLN
jgi:hypothetical protein